MISELGDTGEDPDVDKMRENLNEVIEVVNSLRCVEEEIPILETLAPGEWLIISKDEDGCPVAHNYGGEVRLEMLKESEKTI